MKTFRSPLFIICTILFLLHQLLQHILSINISVADAFLDNLVAMPIIFTILLAERRYLIYKNITYQLTLLEILLDTFYIIAVSEFLFPLLTSRFTFDWLDIVFYCAGAGLYVLLEQPKMA